MKKYIKIISALLCLCIAACAFVSCGDTEEPVNTDMSKSANYGKMSFYYRDSETNEPIYIYIPPTEKNFWLCAIL